MKKCVYCESEVAEQISNFCNKCKTNEQKYGKPGICKYCRLPAAFLNQMCVHCCHSERKLGPPVNCHKCQLKCAFPKDPSLKSKPILCRRCVNAHSPSKSKRPTENKSEIPVDAKKSKIDYDRPSTSRVTDENDSSTQTEHFLLVQQLRAQIVDLKNTILQKDQQLLERDKKIAQLNAEMLQIKTEHKTKMEDQRKNYVNMINLMKDNQRASIKSRQQVIL